MNSTKVSISDFQAGALPEVCVRSGLLAQTRYRVLARKPNGAPVLGAVSLHGSVAKRVSLLRTVGGVAMAGALATSVVALVVSIELLFLATLVFGAVAVASLVLASRQGIHARVTEDGMVELWPASDGFRLAVMMPASSTCSNCSGGSCTGHSHNKTDACETDEALTSAHAH